MDTITKEILREIIRGGNQDQIKELQNKALD